MNRFDVWIVSFLNSFACRSWAFDTFMSEVLEKNDFIKGGVFTALLWWVWFQTDDKEDERREFVLYGRRRERHSADLPSDRFWHFSAEQIRESHSNHCPNWPGDHDYLITERAGGNGLQCNTRGQRRDDSLQLGSHERRTPSRSHAECFHRCDHRHADRRRERHSADLPGDRFRGPEQVRQLHSHHCCYRDHRFCFSHARCARYYTGLAPRRYDE